MPDNLQAHWDTIFTANDEQDLGWFEKDLVQTRKFLDLIEPRTLRTVFIAGAGTSKLADYLAQQGYQLILNDISEQALEQLQSRLKSTAASSTPTFLHQAIELPFQPALKVDLWYDRAVLHFLREKEAIDGYFDNLKSSVNPSGYVLLAEFSKNGAKKCAGLELTRYSIEDMQHHLGSEFQLIESEHFDFINPFGQVRPYIYGLFQRAP